MAENKNFRADAVIALGKLGDKSLLRVLEPLVNEKEDKVQQAYIMGGLALLSPQKYINKLKKLLDVNNIRVQIAAYHALGIANNLLSANVLIERLKMLNKKSSENGITRLK